MEHRLGVPLGDIRVHRGWDAHVLCQRLGARIVVDGLDIFVQQGAYPPRTVDDRHALGRQLQRAMAWCAAGPGQAAENAEAARRDGGADPQPATAATPHTVLSPAVAGHAGLTHPPAGHAAGPSRDGGGGDEGTVRRDMAPVAAADPAYQLLTVTLGYDPIARRAVERPAEGVVATPLLGLVLPQRGEPGAHTAWTALQQLQAAGAVAQFEASSLGTLQRIIPQTGAAYAAAISAQIAGDEGGIAGWAGAHWPGGLASLALRVFHEVFDAVLQHIRAQAAANINPVSSIFSSIVHAGQAAAGAAGHLLGEVGHTATLVVGTLEAGTVAVVAGAGHTAAVVIAGVAHPLEQAALGFAVQAVKAVIRLQVAPFEVPLALGRIAWDHLPSPLAKTLLAECVGVCLGHMDLLEALAGDGLEALGTVVQGGVVGFVRGLTALPPVQAAALLARLAVLLLRPSGAFATGVLEGIATGLWGGVTGLVAMLKDVALLAKGVAQVFNVASVALGGPTLLAQLATTAQGLQTQLGPLLAELSTPGGGAGQGPGAVADGVGRALPGGAGRGGGAGAGHEPGTAPERRGRGSGPGGGRDRGDCAVQRGADVRDGRGVPGGAGGAAGAGDAGDGDAGRGAGSGGPGAVAAASAAGAGGGGRAAQRGGGGASAAGAGHAQAAGGAAAGHGQEGGRPGGGRARSRLGYGQRPRAPPPRPGPRQRPRPQPRQPSETADRRGSGRTAQAVVHGASVRPANARFPCVGVGGPRIGSESKQTPVGERHCECPGRTWYRERSNRSLPDTTGA